MPLRVWYLVMIHKACIMPWTQGIIIFLQPEGYFLVNLILNIRTIKKSICCPIYHLSPRFHEIRPNKVEDCESFFSAQETVLWEISRNSYYALSPRHNSNLSISLPSCKWPHTRPGPVGSPNQTGQSARLSPLVPRCPSRVQNGVKSARLALPSSG
jgi:hypothetical protein